MNTPHPSSSEPTPPPLTELAALAHWLSVPDNEGEPDGEAPPPPASGLAALAALLENETPPEIARAEGAAGRPVYFWPPELMDDREAAPEAAADTPSPVPLFDSAPAMDVAPETDAVETPWATLGFPDLITEPAEEAFPTVPLNLADENLADEPVTSAAVEATDIEWKPQVLRPADPVAEAIETLTQAVIGGNPGDVKVYLETIGRQYSASEAIRIFLAASRGAVG